VNCEAFERWLDEGAPESSAAEAHPHAASCARCAALWRAESAIAAALSRSSLHAPADFTDRVMSRVAEPPAALWTPALPWWTQAAMEPATVLALVIAGLLVALWEPLRTAASGAGALMARGVTSLPTMSIPLSSAVTTGLEIAAVTLLAAAAIPLFGATSRLWTASR
jgi:hypothetical protein